MAQHIMQVAFDFDDETIKQRLEDQCYREIRDKIYEDFRKKFTRFDPKQNYYSYWDRQKTSPSDEDISDILRAEVDKSLDRLCEKYKDEVIDRASTKLAERLARTKKAKELL